MTTDTIERALTAFARIAELPDDRRLAALELLELEDPAVAREIRSLLGFHRPTGQFLDPSQLRRGFEAIDLEPLQPGMRLRGFTVVERLGFGGSSVVYRAEQERPKRSVALKVLGQGQSGPSLLRRLEREADLLGRLGHPGIAQIYEAGVEDLGDGERAFLALELIEGVPIDRYATDRGLADRERVSLLIQVADAVRHAHLAGVVHLDLKPANILVRNDGTPKVLDFGVGRDLTDPQHDESLGLTLAYAAPEQLDAGLSPDMRSDVFALGVVLFQMLTGRRPLETDGLVPSDAAARLSATQRPGLRTLRPDLSADLEGVVARALELAPEARYQSVGEFAEDLRRYLEDRPVRARQESAIDSLRRAARRGRRYLVASAIVGALLAVAATIATGAAIRSASLAEAELAARNDAEEMAGLLMSEAGRLRQASYRSAIGHADAALLSGDGARARRILETCEPALRAWEWHTLRSRTDLSTHVVDTVPPGGTVAATSPDGRQLLVAGYEGPAVLISTDPPAVLRRFESGEPSSLLSVTGSGLVARLSFEQPGAVCRLETLEVIAPLPAAPGMLVAASPVDSRLLMTSADQSVRVLNAESPEATARVLPLVGRFASAAWSRDGRLIALGDYVGRVIVHDLGTGATQERPDAHTDAVRAVAFDRTARALASVSNDGTVHVWDLEPDEPRFSAKPSDNKLSALCWAEDDRTIFVGGTRRTIYGLDASTGITTRRLVGHANTVLHLSAAGPN